MTTRKDALKYAIQQRRCPPDAERAGTEYNGHCKVCPWCEPGASMGRDQDFDELSVAFKNRFGSNGNEPVMSGNIRVLSVADRPWQENFYFSPPAVLVLEKHGTTCVVAQVFFDVSLAAPGDLVVGDLVIETWNIYEVRLDCIGRQVHHQPDIVPWVRKMILVPGWLPDDAPKPRPLYPDDPRPVFRTLEKKTAEVYAASPEAPALFYFLDTGRLVRSILGVNDRIEWNSDPMTVPEVFAMAELPESCFSLAAADEETRHSNALLYVFRGEILENIFPVAAEESWIRETDDWLCSVYLPDLPLPPERAWVWAGQEGPDGRVVFPDSLESSIRDSSFTVGFRSMGTHPPVLKTVIIYHHE